MKSYTTSNGITLSNGIKVQFLSSVNEKYENQEFYVEGVGTAIKLINVNDLNAATDFNQNIGNWNMTSVVTVRGMLSDASSFDQLIQWDINSITDFYGVFNGTDGFLFGTFDTYNTKFSGYLDELRMWDSVLTDSNFTEHTKYPKSIKLDNPLEIPSSLKVRVDIEQEFRTDMMRSMEYHKQQYELKKAAADKAAQIANYQRQQAEQQGYCGVHRNAVG